MSFKKRRKAAVVLLVSGLSCILAAFGAPQASNAEEGLVSAAAVQAHASFLVVAFQAASASQESGIPVTDVASLNTAAGLTGNTAGVFTQFVQTEQGARLCLRFTDGLFLSMEAAVTGETWVRYSTTDCAYESVPGVVVEGSLRGGNDTGSRLGSWTKGASLMGDWLPGNLAGGIAPQ